MKARHGTAPPKTSHPDPRGLEISVQKKMLKMKSAPNGSLKTKGQKKSSSEFVENKGVNVFS
jgi:hypothetical protein